MPKATHRLHNRIGWIDAGRGLAAVMVMFYHFGAFTAPIFKHYVDFGYIGVALFFFISGYIIPASALPASPKPVARFWLSRIFRLYPTYWVSVALAALIVGGHWSNILANATMVQRFLGKDDLLGLYWTLQVELIFYGIITILLSRRLLDTPLVSLWGSAISVMLCGGLAGVRYFLHVKTPLTGFLSLSLMFSGNFWYWYNARQAFTSRQAGSFYGGFLPCIYGIAFLGYHDNWGRSETPLRFIIGYTIALCFFIALSRLEKQRVPALVYLGTISYSIYLYHTLVMYVLWDHVGGFADDWLRILICFAVTLVVAGIGFRWIEVPGIAMGKAIIKRVGCDNERSRGLDEIAPAGGKPLVDS